MASFKVSQFSGVANTTDDSLLMLSYTTDNGATYETRKIRIADFLDDIDPTTKADLDVDDLETLVGAGAGTTNLGTFPGDIIPDNTTVKQALLLLEQNAGTKQATVTAGNGLEFTGATLDVILAAGQNALESFTLSGMSDSNHNDTYTVVRRTGVKLKGRMSQSGSSITVDIEREAPFTFDISGTGLAAADGETVTLRGKHNGYLSRSGDVYTWNTGVAPINSLRHWYYWNETSQIFVAYNNTDVEWTVFDLSQATGNVASFISDLNGGSGSTLYYVSGGESFELTSGNKATLSNSSTTYPGESILYVPSDGGNVTYGTASNHPYYIYQNAAGNKWVAFSDDNYWTGWYRTAAFDLSTEALSDDQVAFSIDSTSAFEFISTSSDQDGDSVNIPPSGDSSVTYLAASSDSFLEFDSGALAVKVKDEDDLVSDSDEHVATQQSVKAYVDNTTAATVAAITPNYINKDGSIAMAADLNVDGNKVINLATPTTSSDAATKAYVDTATAGQGAFWSPVDLHADSNITLSGEQTIDGVLTSSSRVLVSGQTTQSENGIYVSGAGAWTRATDADDAGEFLTNKTVFVKFGDTKSGHVEAYTGIDNPTLGSTSIVFVTKSEAATLADGSITTAKIADLAVTSAKISDLDASKLTGTIADARIAASGVTQHQSALAIAFTQLTGTAADAQVPSSAVTQHQGLLSLTKSQISDFSDADYFSAGAGIGVTIEQGTIRQSLGTAASDTSLGTFTGSTISDSATVKSALQEVETAIENLAIADLTDGSNVVEASDNVNRLVGSTGADGEPTNYLFMVVDQADGSIKFIDKSFIEIE